MMSWPLADGLLDVYLGSFGGQMNFTRNGNTFDLHVTTPAL